MGTHRVQRIPRNGGGRRHTSTATVAVLKGDTGLGVIVDEADLREDVFRSGGKGGQHANKVSSAVRLTHIPSGLVVVSEAERSQWLNRQHARRELEVRLQRMSDRDTAAAVNSERRVQVQSDRAAKMFTHNEQRSEVVADDGRRWDWRAFYRGRV